MDDIEQRLLAEIRHIQGRLRAMSSDILALCNGEEAQHLTMEDALILQEIADGFDAEVGPPERPTLKVVPKSNGQS